MTTEQIVSVSSLIIATTAILAFVVIAVTCHFQASSARADAYEYGWSEGVLDALRKHGPTTDEPERRLVWIAVIDQVEANPYGRVGEPV